MDTKRLVLLGSTGSIGTQALEVAEKLGYPVLALSANRQVDLIEQQIRRFRPAMAAMSDEAAAADLKARVADLPVRVLSGTEGLCELAALPEADVVLNAIVGVAGLQPTLAALTAGHDVALANKETLVAGGALVTETAKAHGARLLPVDSEHSAIFQCLQGAPTPRALKKLILTASGGPFFGKTAEQLQNVTAADALKHPNWDMGAKITIDSATMMNKGLELMEARWLFDMPPESIDIVVHRESIVHSLIEYDDNAVLAQLGLPDMRIPIQYALTYPHRVESPAAPLSLADIGTLTFARPDNETFPGMNICRRALTAGGTAAAAVNAANEQAVALFLAGKIGFLDISRLAGEMLDLSWPAIGGLSDILEADSRARQLVRERAAGLKG
ncbi:MAG: 1-deoxy-D-xylulose-5-phosphate reductoisomerase [Clostridia bacterium]|nr:1-deoxy-D-xylulose-5-phosphate reductoisomerase [Clostridia bacterium]